MQAASAFVGISNTRNHRSGYLHHNHRMLDQGAHAQPVPWSARCQFDELSEWLRVRRDVTSQR